MSIVLPCPIWCTTDHTGEVVDDIMDLRSHHGELLYETDRPGGRVLVYARIACTDNCAEGTRGPVGIDVAVNEALTPVQTRRLIEAMQEGLAIIDRHG
jgi:hypothetical protein